MAEATTKRPQSSAKRGKSSKKKKTEEKRVIRREEEEEPVLSGRLVAALALMLAMLIIPTSQLGKYITKTTPSTERREAWKLGQEASLHITVVTADYNQLACASPKKVGASHCEWENDRERWPHQEGDPVDDNRKHVLQPYKTTDDALVLIAGLWAEPEMAMRLHNEPVRGVTKERLARFVVTCDVKFFDQLETVNIRWNSGSKWGTEKNVMVGEPSNCEIAAPDKP